MSNKPTRRTLLKLAGAGSIGFTFGTSNVGASESNSDGPSVGELLANRRFDYSLSVVNNDQNPRTVDVEIRRKTNGDQNPAVFSERYDLGAAEPGSNQHVAEEGPHLPVGPSGTFEIVTVTETGQEASSVITLLGGNFPRHQSATIRVTSDDVEVLVSKT